MSASRFDVDDAALRDEFLRHEALSALAGLAERARPQWGRMTPQQMVEHLIWAFEISTGKVETVCTTPESERSRIRGFLYRNTPMPRDFMNPLLAAGLPPLRYATLDGAKTALGEEVACFLGQASRGDALHTHPVIGPMGPEDWHRIHYKHVHHHLQQFGLVEAA